MNQACASKDCFMKGKRRKKLFFASTCSPVRTCIPLSKNKFKIKNKKNKKKKPHLPQPITNKKY